jgi:hypothetical protein
LTSIADCYDKETAKQYKEAWDEYCKQKRKSRDGIRKRKEKLDRSLRICLNLYYYERYGEKYGVNRRCPSIVTDDYKLYTSNVENGICLDCKKPRCEDCNGCPIDVFEKVEDVAHCN